MSFISFMLFYLVASSSAQSCLTSSEDYAAEVVVPSYSLPDILVMAQKEGANYIMRSQYNSGLITLLSEINNPIGLSVRLQLPTEINEVRRPHIRFISSSAPGTIREPHERIFSGWKIQCNVDECLFEKDLVSVTAPRTGPASEIFVEINQELASCSSTCSGVCFKTNSDQKCIDSSIKRDLDILMRYINASSDITPLFNSYRIIGTEGIVVIDIVSSSSYAPDWKEAMRQELVFLKTNGVITLSREQIEDIVSLTRQGRAGQNYRIVLDQNNTWRYANDIPQALLSEDRDCKSYALPVLIPKNTDEGYFYLVPLFLLAAGILVFILLIIIARLMNSSHRRDRRKLKGKI